MGLVSSRVLSAGVTDHPGLRGLVASVCVCVCFLTSVCRSMLVVLSMPRAAAWTLCCLLFVLLCLTRQNESLSKSCRGSVMFVEKDGANAGCEAARLGLPPVDRDFGSPREEVWPQPHTN